MLELNTQLRKWGSTVTVYQLCRFPWVLWSPAKQSKDSVMC
uniref:Uncharacterized protein n=1 Tax=Anguilla anguilla TaxID=7936 RepID=A0A0E9T736_ANGAN